MVDAQIDGGADGCAPIVKALPRRAVDQIDAGTHACCIGRGDSGGDVFRRMRTVERCKHMRYRGLHAEGNTIETAVCEFFHIVGIHRVGIRFGGDFRVIGDAPCGAYRIQHGDQIACLECGRRTAAEEDGCHLRLVDTVRCLPIADNRHFADNHVRVVAA